MTEELNWSSKHRPDTVWKSGKGCDFPEYFKSQSNSDQIQLYSNYFGKYTFELYEIFNDICHILYDKYKPGCCIQSGLNKNYRRTDA